MPTRRRTLLPFLLLAHAAVARAQGAGGAAVAPWPTRPLRLIVPFAPGGVTDRLGRMLAESLAPRLGQPVQVENLVGAGTVVGARAAAAAAPDGHTLLLATSTTLAINPALHRGALPYDPVRDFAPVALVAAVPFVLVARRADGPESLAALLAEVRRAGPGGLAYGSAGPGTPHHLGMEMLRTQAGMAMTHVPYRGSAAALSDLLGGRFRAMVAELALALPHLRDGALRPLAVTTARRLPELPEVPTMAEAASFPDYELVAWQGVLAPAGTPGPVVAQLADMVLGTFGSADGARRLAAMGLVPFLMGPSEFAAFVPAEIARWAPIVRASGATVE